MVKTADLHHQLRYRMGYKQKTTLTAATKEQHRTVLWETFWTDPLALFFLQISITRIRWTCRFLDRKKLFPSSAPAPPRTIPLPTFQFSMSTGFSCIKSGTGCLPGCPSCATSEACIKTISAMSWQCHWTLGAGFPQITGSYCSLLSVNNKSNLLHVMCWVHGCHVSKDSDI